MGVITVFSLKTCPHCKKVKGLFADLGWEYNEVSLTDYPEKRSDMLALADRLTVPQVFFGEQHLGGASDVADLQAQGKLQGMYEELMLAPASEDKRLLKPDYLPKEEKGAAPLTEEQLCVGAECWSYAGVVELLQGSLQFKDRSYHGKTYKKCFVGKEAADFLMERFKLPTRGEAVQIAQSFMDVGMFKHVTDDHAFKDEVLFYRMQADATPQALNTWRKWADRVDDPMLTVKRCRGLFSNLQNKHMANDGSVDYLALAQDPDFQAFQEATCEFQLVDPLVMSLDTRLAFFINIYNLAVLHAFAAVGIATSSLRRLSFFDSVGYVVGELFYSLSDMENGVLRGNKKAVMHLRKHFTPGDPRLQIALPEVDCRIHFALNCGAKLQVALPEVDCRIHFALNCGAKSCPPIKNFTAEAVQEELRIAALAFCEMEDSVAIDAEKRVLTLTKIISWYRSDFGEKDADVARTLAPFMRNENKTLMEDFATNGRFKIKFFKYDWSTNASNFTTYDPEALKVDSGCVVS